MCCSPSWPASSPLPAPTHPPEPRWVRCMVDARGFQRLTYSLRPRRCPHPAQEMLSRGLQLQPSQRARVPPSPSRRAPSPHQACHSLGMRNTCAGTKAGPSCKELSATDVAKSIAISSRASAPLRSPQLPIADAGRPRRPSALGCDRRRPWAPPIKGAAMPPSESHHAAAQVRGARTLRPRAAAAVSESSSSWPAAQP